MAQKSLADLEFSCRVLNRPIANDEDLYFKSIKFSSLLLFCFKSKSYRPITIAYKQIYSFIFPKMTDMPIQLKASRFTEITLLVDIIVHAKG